VSIDTINPREARALAAAQAVPSQRAELLRELVRRKAFIVGMVILLFWIFCAIAPGALPSHSPYSTDLLNINQAPSGSHWFGTDQLGRDMFARVIAGARDVLIIAPLATLLGTIIGTAIGLVMGYFRGAVDDVVSRFVEAFLALPLVVTGILGVVALGSSIPTMIIIIGIVFAPLIARTVRAAVLLERDLDYVQAAKLRGESSLYIMFREILPNVMAPIVVEFTVRLGYAVFTLVSLSFLGFGLGPPSPNWGSDIGSNYGLVIAGYWWEVLFDALAVASLVIAVNLISTSIEATVEDT
jgi:peptide/nickel transport system permease protein